MLMKKCNYADTVEGSLLINTIINQIDNSEFSQSLLLLKWGLRLIETVTLFSDLTEFAQASQGYMFHQDLYNSGLILGKLGKLAT